MTDDPKTKTYSPLAKVEPNKSSSTFNPMSLGGIIVCVVSIWPIMWGLLAYFSFESGFGMTNDEENFARAPFILVFAVGLAAFGAGLTAMHTAGIGRKQS